jgi:tetratricopeptide (TPR) repeat protein
VNRIPQPAWLRLLQHYRAHLLVLLSLVIVGVGAARWYQQGQVQRATLMRLYSAAKVQQDNRQYEEAWKLLEQVRSLAPDDPEAQEKEAKLAMLWLENARITQLENSESGKTTVIGMGSFAAIVDTVLPALSRCAVSSEKIYAANCLAHMGWGEVLKNTSAGAHPQTYYQRALALDPENPYAHVLWGFHILRTDGSPDEAKMNFERALASGRERPFVRAVQLSAWLNKSGDLGISFVQLSC